MNKQQKSIVNIINIPLLLIFIVSAVGVSYNVLKYKFLEIYYLNKVAIFILLLLMLMSAFLIWKNKAKIFNMIFLIFINIVLLFSYMNIRQVVGLFNTINNNAAISEYTMSVVVMKNSNINTVKDLTTNNVYATFIQDNDNTKELLAKVKETDNVSFNLLEGNSYIENYDNLLTDNNSAMIMNDAYETFIEAKYPDFKEKTKKIYEYKIKKKVDVNAGKVGQSFNIYISGIDTYGDVSTVSRSDVNIIMTINKKTNKILLTTTPRDSYVKIADGGNNEYDKLTHAGIYGINSSVHTLENLYNTKIDYYARLNFTSFTKLIDLIGGIDVYNDQAFNSHIGHYDFAVGMQHLDSKKALAFVRERYSLSGGDNDRGKNQEKVIAAIIKKLSSKEALSNYNKVIDELSKSIQTNMPLDMVVGLANEQLSSNKDYIVSSQSLTGHGRMGLSSYAMPGYNLYMTEVDDKSLKEVSENIKNVLMDK